VCGGEEKIEVIKYLFDSPRENDESDTERREKES
jgi:hypothetical protein